MARVFDNAYTILNQLGKGGMASVFLATVDPSKFDYSTLFAYTQVLAPTHGERRRKAEELAATLKGQALDPTTMRTLLSAQGIPVPGPQVALKIANSQQNRARLEAEWQQLLCLKHPNLIEVYGGGECEGCHYYAMELLPDLVEPGRIRDSFPIRDKLQILVEAGRGLQYLHENGVIHRDVKPGNILTREISPGRYQTKLTDLGLAKNLAENLGLTQGQVLLGSPAYMAPEQIGDAGDVDARADVYSLGVSLYEMVTGLLPYHDRSQPYQIIIAVSTRVPPIPAGDHVPDLPRPVAAIIETAMAFDRDARYPTVAAFIADVERYLRDENKRFTSAISFRDEDKGISGVDLGQGDYACETIIRRENPSSPLLAPTTPPELPADIEAYRVLVMNRKQAQHALFERLAKGLRLEYAAATSPLEATLVLSEKRLPDIAVVEYVRRDAPTLRLCEQLKQQNIPYLLHGAVLDRTDILLASRLGAAAVMLHPVQEKPLREKLLKLLETSGKAPAPPAKETAVTFRGAKTPAEKARLVARNAPQIMVLQPAASKTISLCNDPNASADDLAKPVQSDSAIAAMVLRRANSALLGGNRRIVSIRDAIVRIGRRETKQMAMAMTVYKLFDKTEKTFCFNRYMYWIHALGVGLAAQMIAERLTGAQTQDAFLGGLLHDIGKIVFDDHLNAEYQQVIRQAGADAKRMCEVEQAIFELNHAALGARVAEKWSLPESVIAAIAGHHRPWSVPAEGRPTIDAAGLAALGNSLVKAMGLGHGGDVFVDDLPADVWTTALGSLDSVPKYCQQLTSELGEFVELLDIGAQQAQVNLHPPKREQAIGIVPDGFGTLLHFFFCARGFPVRTLDWSELAKTKLDIAADARSMPEEVFLQLHGEEFWNRHVYLLGGDEREFRNRGIHCIAPANDFFRLEKIVREISQDAAAGGAA